MSCVPLCFSLLVTFINFFAVQESLWVLCNAKIPRLQLCKSVESVCRLCNLEMCLSFWCAQSRPIVLPGALGSTLTWGWSFPDCGFLVGSWPYEHACPSYAVCLDWKVICCKGYSSWLGCNRHLPSVIHHPLFSICSNVIWDIVILCLKWGREKNHTLGTFLLDRRKEKLWETSLF